MNIKIRLIFTSTLFLLFTGTSVYASDCEIEYKNLTSLKNMERKNERWYKRKVVSDEKYENLKKQIHLCKNEWNKAHSKKPQ